MCDCKEYFKYLEKGSFKKESIIPSFHRFHLKDIIVYIYYLFKYETVLKMVE